MQIADNIIKKKLKNVYFLWGSGKTVTANALAEKYGFYVYHTDDRTPLFKLASPEYQPAMCRNVPDFWALEKDDALAWENAIVREMTPMIVCELMSLAQSHKLVLCEGDIDIDGIIGAATNAVTIVNRGRSYDFFDRPEQAHMLDGIRLRTDIGEDEKRRLIDNAYKILDSNKRSDELPREVSEYGIHPVFRDETTDVDSIALTIARYWNITE